MFDRQVLRDATDRSVDHGSSLKSENQANFDIFVNKFT